MSGTRSAVRSASSLMVAVLLIAGQAHALAEDAAPTRPPANELRERVALIMQGGSAVGEPSEMERLRAYTQENGVPLHEICRVLQAFVEEGRGLPAGDASRTKRMLCDGAVSLLGELRCLEAAPILKEIALGEADGEGAQNLRRAAVRAVVQLGGEDLLDFAGALCQDGRFNNLDRLMLYRAISAYVGVDSWRTIPARTTDTGPGQRALRGDVFRFLANAVTHDRATDCVMRTDQALSAASRFYAHSDGRQGVLKKLSKDGIAMHEEYAARELKALAKVPLEERTRLPGDMTAAELAALAASLGKQPQEYGELDRLLVYEALAEKGGGGVAEALLGAIRHERAPDNVIRLDQLLCAASEEYKTSRQREAILGRHENSDVPRRKEYFARELKALREVPADKRTHESAEAKAE